MEDIVADIAEDTNTDTAPDTQPEPEPDTGAGDEGEKSPSPSLAERLDALAAEVKAGAELEDYTQPILDAVREQLGDANLVTLSKDDAKLCIASMLRVTELNKKRHRLKEELIEANMDLCVSLAQMARLSGPIPTPDTNDPGDYLDTLVGLNLILDISAVAEDGLPILTTFMPEGVSNVFSHTTKYERLAKALLGRIQ